MRENPSSFYSIAIKEYSAFFNQMDFLFYKAFPWAG
jgi:hypothetical protein